MIARDTGSLFTTNLLFGILYLSFKTPVVFFMGGIPAVMQLEGIDAASIGLFQLIGLPSVIKFLPSPLIDRFVFKKNHYKKWIFLLGTIYAATLYATGYLNLINQFYAVFIIVFFAALLSNLIDIPLNALSIKVFQKNDRISASGYKVSAYFVSGILGSGFMLIIFNHFGWKYTFSTLSAFVFFSMASLFFIEENYEQLEKEQTVSFYTIMSFFRRPKIGIWLFILLFYYSFILAVWIFIKPYLIMKGVDTDDVAVYVGFYGSGVGFLGGVLASRMGKYFTKKEVLIYFGLLQIISIAVLIVMELFEFSVPLVITSISLIAVSVAFSSTIIFALIMDYSREDSKGTDYAVQSSLVSIIRIISTIVAGFLISAFGYGPMFCVELAGASLVVFVIYIFYKT